MTVLKTEIHDGIALLTMNRPEVFNALDRNLLTELSNAMEKLALDREIRGVIITGEGRAFCCGGDLKWIDSQGKNYTKTFYDLVGIFNRCISNIRMMPKLCVAAINGLAAGGGMSLSLSCDFRVMDASATLMQAYTSRGLSIDGGGTFSLPRLVGLSRALEIVAFDDIIDAKKAFSWGLVTEVVGDGESKQGAIRLIEKIKKIPLSSFAVSKELLYESFQTPFDMQLKKEQIMIAGCAGKKDGREGIAAFLEKRSPVFT